MINFAGAKPSSERSQQDRSNEREHGAEGQHVQVQGEVHVALPVGWHSQSLAEAGGIAKQEKYCTAKDPSNCCCREAKTMIFPAKFTCLLCIKKCNL